MSAIRIYPIFFLFLTLLLLATTQCCNEQLAVTQFLTTVSPRKEVKERSFPHVAPHVALRQYSKIARSVCKIVLPYGIVASGFIGLLPIDNDEIAGLVTNDHVISGEDLEGAFSGRIIFEFTVEFEGSNFQDRIGMNVIADFKRWFANAELDATFLELKTATLIRLIEAGVRPLKISTGHVHPTQHIAIMQYPSGGHLSVATSVVTETHGEHFKHTVSTEMGSSGSPVIEMATWGVIGIHKSRSADDESELYNWAVSTNSVATAVLEKFMSTTKYCAVTRGTTLTPRTKATRRSRSTRTTSKTPPTTTTTTAIPSVELVLAKNLIEAAKRGDFGLAKGLVQKGALCNANDSSFFNYTALHYCAKGGYADIAKLLLENGARIEGKIDTGETPFLLACWYGKIELVKILIDNGADVNAQDNVGNTALILASFSDFEDIVKILIDHPHLNTLNHRNKENQTALYWAADWKHQRIVDLLKSKGGLA